MYDPILSLQCRLPPLARSTGPPRTPISADADTCEAPTAGAMEVSRMKTYRSFTIGMGAMVFLAMAAAHARQLGAVNFANGSTRPTHISRLLLDQAKASTTKPGQVVLLRAGASPVGGAAFNFVLSGERAAAVRNILVSAGIPRKKIVSQFVGIVNRGSAAKDREVIVDATTRAALGLAPAPSTGQTAAIRRLEGQVQALEAAQVHKKAVAAKPAAAAYTGRIWYATRTATTEASAASGFWYPNSGGTYPTVIGGDNYQSTGYGFSLHQRRPTEFSFWTPYEIPLRFSLAGMSQKWQVANPVTTGTEAFTITSSGYLFYPANTRDSVSTQFLHGSIQSPWRMFGVTITPGVQVGWLGVQSLAGGEQVVAGNPSQPPDIVVATTTATSASALRVTPSLSVGGPGWQIGYSQSPWGADGFFAPRVLEGTVHRRGVRLVLGFAFPDCPLCIGGLQISRGEFVKIGAHGGGWGGTVTYVVGEQFEGAQGMTLAQVLAPYNPQRPWNSYNPGLTISVSKKLARDVSVAATYGVEQSGGGSGPGHLIVTGGSSSIKTTEISLRGTF